MQDTPSIEIFAQSPAEQRYLADIVALAGYKVRSSLDPAVLTIDAKTIQNPMRAADLVKKIRQLVSAQIQAPEIVEIGPHHKLDLRQGLWIPAEGERTRLTEKEVAILSFLKNAMPNTVAKQALLEKVWAYVEGVETHTLETHIYRLRQKIEIDPSNPKILLTQDDGYSLAE